MTPRPFPHDTTLDGPDDEPEPRPDHDLDDGWDLEAERDRLDRYYEDEPQPRRIVLDFTGSRFAGPF